MKSKSTDTERRIVNIEHLMISMAAANAPAVNALAAELKDAEDPQAILDRMDTDALQMLIGVQKIGSSTNFIIEQFELDTPRVDPLGDELFVPQIENQKPTGRMIYLRPQEKSHNQGEPSDYIDDNE